MDKTYVYSNSDQLYFDYGDDKDDGAGCDDYDDNNNEGSLVNALLVTRIADDY